MRLRLWMVGILLATTSEATAQQFRLRIRDFATASAVDAALAGAARRLEQPECARVLSDFSDTTGRTLQQNLDALELRPGDYLRYVVFADGWTAGGCTRGDGRLAFTAPGSRVVFVCPAFRKELWKTPARAEAVLIHEILHTLGLGENPPSSAVITKQVLARCGREES